MAKLNLPKSPTTTFHNALVMLLVIIGNFILYRYIKNVEKDTKILHTYILELNEKIKQISTRQVVQPTPLVHKTNTTPDIDNDDDTESVGSQDITNLLKKVMFPDETDQTHDTDIDIDMLNVLQCMGMNNEKIKQISTRQMVQPTPLVHNTNTTPDIDNDDDTESVGSQDITNLLKKVMFPDETDQTHDTDIDNMLNVLQCMGMNKCEQLETETNITIYDINEEIVKENTDVDDVTEVVDALEVHMSSVNMPVYESHELDSPSDTLDEHRSSLENTKSDDPITGDIVIKTSDKISYSSFTNDELRKILRNKGLSTKGVKSDLITRITDNE